MAPSHLRHFSASFAAACTCAIAGPVFHTDFSLPGESPAILADEKSHWLTPSFPITPNAWQKIRISSVNSSPGAIGIFWANPTAKHNREPESGNPLFLRPGQLLFQNITSIPPASGSRVTFSRTPPTAAVQFVRVSGASGGLTLRSLTIEPATAAEILEWSSAIRRVDLRGISPATTPPADRFEKLPKTFATLKSGGNLRIAMVGDSIITDTINSFFDLHLGKSHPAATISLIDATGHGTGMAPWSNPDPTSWREAGLDLDQAVIQQSPDLVILGGISNGGRKNLAAAPALIRRLKTPGVGHKPPEILLMSGPAYQKHDATLSSALAKVASDEGIAFFDFSEAWHRYLGELQKHGVSADSLKRDNTHNNDAGKQTLSQIMELYFSR